MAQRVVRRLTLLLGLFAAWPACAQQQAPLRTGLVDGNKLFELCSTTPLKRVYAEFYITGVFDHINLHNASSPVCVPKGSTWDQAFEIVCKYHAEHPEIRTSDASLGVQTALASAWPCSAK